MARTQGSASEPGNKRRSRGVPPHGRGPNAHNRPCVVCGNAQAVKWFFALPADPQECLTPFVNYTWWCSGTPDKTDNYANEVKPANGRSDHNRHACVRKRQADPRSTHAWMLTE